MSDKHDDAYKEGYNEGKNAGWQDKWANDLSSHIGTDDSVDDSRNAGFKDGMSDKYDDDNSNYHGASDDDSGGCFVTTACMKSKGLPDDCIELTTLRTFRDTYVLNLSTGQKLYFEYKLLAPRIVLAINNREDSKDVYDEIYSIILQIVALINDGNNSLALDEYIQMINSLKETLL